MTLPGWTREPLVHFLIAGFVVFLLFAWRGDGVDPASRVITVDDAVQAQLAARFEQTMGRAPTDAELDAQIKRYVRDEVLYREGLRLGLDQGDAVVRRRLVTKMDLAASARAETAQPNDATLRSWYDDNRERYGGAVSLSFDQLYFEAEVDALAALTRGSSQGELAGEVISLPAALEAANARQISDRFGAEFTSSLLSLEAGEQWQGPVRSGFGWHVVRVRAKEVTDAPDFASIRGQVENDWRSATIAERKQRAYQILREAYRVEIDR